jgi:hypothetical protein
MNEQEQAQAIVMLAIMFLPIIASFFGFLLAVLFLVIYAIKLSCWGIQDFLRERRLRAIRERRMLSHGCIRDLPA